jgi:hypothetical protein
VRFRIEGKHLDLPVFGIAARSHIAEGTRLYALAGRPTETDFIKVYGPKGPKMTWVQRAQVGVDAKHFQEALAAKHGA